MIQTVRIARPVSDLVVFFVPSAEAWSIMCEAMRSAGFEEVESFNPCRAQRGRTFEDPDGYRVVIEQSSWRGASGGDD